MKKLITFGFVLMCLLGCSNKQRNIEDYFNEVFPEANAGIIKPVGVPKEYWETIQVYGNRLIEDLSTYYRQKWEDNYYTRNIYERYLKTLNKLNTSITDVTLYRSRYSSSTLIDVYGVIFEYEVDKNKVNTSDYDQTHCYIPAVISFKKKNREIDDFQYSKEIFSSLLYAEKALDEILLKFI